MPSAYTATVNAVDYGFDFIDKEIEIDATATDSVAADLKVAIREAEASENGIVFDQVGFMGNPVVLDPSGPISTALSVVLLSTWRVLSLATSGTFTLGGGNTVNETTGADVFATNVLATMINNLSQAGVITSTGSGLSAGEQAQLARIYSLLDVIEGSLDHAEVMRLLLAAVAGKVSGADSTNMLFRDLADSKDRIDADVDEFGNRIGITLDATP